MGAFYRLSDLGYRLPSGTHVLAPEAFEPVAAAQRLVDDARARAAEIEAEAEAAYEAKCREGYAAGLEEARSEAIRRLLDESAGLDAALRATEADLVHVVCACLRKLMTDFDDAVRAEVVVRKALKQMRREKRAELRVSPAQIDLFKAKIDGILSEFPEMELIDLVEDPSLAPPRIVLETRIGRVEADMSARLNELETMIRDAARPFAEAPQ